MPYVTSASMNIVAKAARILIVIDTMRPVIIITIFLHIRCVLYNHRWYISFYHVPNLSLSKLQLPLSEALAIIQGSEGYCASKVLKEEMLMDLNRVRKLV